MDEVSGRLSSNLGSATNEMGGTGEGTWDTGSALNER